MNKRQRKKNEKRNFEKWQEKYKGQIWLVCERSIFKRYTSREKALLDLPYKDPSVFSIYIPEENKLYRIEEYTKKSS